MPEHLLHLFLLHPGENGGAVRGHIAEGIRRLEGNHVPAIGAWLGRLVNRRDADKEDSSAAIVSQCSVRRHEDVVSLNRESWALLVEYLVLSANIHAFRDLDPVCWPRSCMKIAKNLDASPDVAHNGSLKRRIRSRGCDPRGKKRNNDREHKKLQEA
jgi:hypothetical protein